MYKLYGVNCVHPADMRQTMLSNDNNDNESNNRPVCKIKRRKIIAKVNGMYTEILIDTGAELSS